MATGAAHRATGLQPVAKVLATVALGSSVGDGLRGAIATGGTVRNGLTTAAGVDRLQAPCGQALCPAV